MAQLPLKIALIGCGQIADAHLQEIRKIRMAQPVAVCDRHLDLAKQAAVRFGVPAVFTDLDAMLDQVQPDVLHVTTPPHTHAALACLALQRGVHVYLEKPFTINVIEADEVLRTAQANRRYICVGHDQLFDPLWLECRQLYERGQLGEVVHVDSIQPYDLSGPFGRLIASSPDHWIQQLPGKLFHNIISHALYKITDFLPDPEPGILATAFSRHEHAHLPTELRVVLGGQQVTGQLLFSTRIRPLNRVVRIWGTRQQLEIDFDTSLVRSIRSNALPGALGRVEAPYRQLLQVARLFGRNAWRFLRCRLHYFAGMRKLFEKFYRAIHEESEPPIPYHEIRRVTLILDRIFATCMRGLEEPALAATGTAGGPVR